MKILFDPRIKSESNKIHDDPLQPHFIQYHLHFLNYGLIRFEEQEKINNNLNLCCIIFWQAVLS